MTPVRRMLCVGAVLAITGASPQARGDFVYDDFSDVSGLMLNGSSVQDGNVLRLTSATPWQSGSAFTVSAEELGNLNSFSTHFRFRITQSGGISDQDGSGADGIVFVLQTVSNSIGGSGGGIGYQDIPNSVGVEFDTWNNGAGYSDPDGNHVGIDTEGNIASLATGGEPVRLNNDEIWHAWVDYNGATQLLEARWSMDGVRPAPAGVSAVLDLVDILGQDSAYLGFTSGTGSAWGNHDILSWQYRAEYAPIPEPSSLALGCLGLLGLARLHRRRVA